MRKIITHFFYLPLLLVLICAHNSNAQCTTIPVSLEPTFATSGKLSYPAQQLVAASKILAQPDGKYLAAGYIYNSTTDNMDIIVERFDENGTRDVSFGVNGVAVYDYASQHDYIYDMGLTSDNKIVLVGYTAGWADQNGLVVKLTSNGSLDQSFGAGGFVSFDAGFNYNEQFTSLALDAANGIFLGGNIQISSYQNVLTVKLTASGARDNSYGSSGIFSTNLSPGGDDIVYDLQFNPNTGALYLGGSYYEASTSSLDSYVIAINASATAYMTSFSGDGQFYADLSGGNRDDGINAIQLTPDGKLLFTGYAKSASGMYGKETMIGRFDTSGDLDASFGTGGITMLLGSFGNDEGMCFALQPDGKIFVGGYVSSGSIGSIIRLNPNGSFDTSFDSGADGVYMSYDIGILNSLQITSNGRLLGTGMTQYPYTDFPVLSYRILCTPSIIYPTTDITYGESAANGATSTSTGAFTYSIKSGSSLLSINTTSGAITAHGAGSAQIKIYQAPTASFYGDSAFVTVNINKAELTVTPQNATKEYGEAEPAIALSYSGFKFTDNESVINTAPTATASTSESSDADDYTITVSGGSADNYTFNTSATATLTVTKAALIVTPQNATKEYGDAEPAITLSYSGFKLTDGVADLNTVPTATASTNANSAIGNYTIAVSGGSDNNYTFNTTATATLAVTKAELIVTPQDATKEYGEVEPAIALSYSGFKLTDGVADLNTLPTATASTSAASDAGDYTIAVSGGSDEHYTFNTTATATLSVTKAELIVTPQNATKVYGDAEPTITLSYSGFKLTDDVADLNAVPTATASTSATSAVDDYTITVSGGNDDNYTFNTTAIATLSITKKALTVRADDLSRAQGEVNPALTYTVDGFVNNEDETDLTGAIELTTIANATSTPGDYAIVVDFSNVSSQNYSFSKVDGTLSVTAVPTGIFSRENTYTLLLSPNPALDGRFKISGPQELTEVQVINVLGQKEVFYSNDISTSLSGVLTVVLKSDDKTYVGKVVVP